MNLVNFLVFLTCFYPQSTCLEGNYRGCRRKKKKKSLLITFLSTPVHMHGGLLCITFCLSVCLSGCDLTKIQTRQKVTRQKFISQEPFDIWSPKSLQVATLWVLARCKSLSQSWLVAGLRLNGRCAHFNVKLLHFSYQTWFQFGGGLVNRRI